MATDKKAKLKQADLTEIKVSLKAIEDKVAGSEHPLERLLSKRLEHIDHILELIENKAKETS